MSKVTDLLKTSLDALNDWDSDRAASYILRDAMTYLHRAVSVLASEREPTEGDAAFIAGARTATETSIDMVTTRLRGMLGLDGVNRTLPELLEVTASRLELGAADRETVKEQSAAISELTSEDARYSETIQILRDDLSKQVEVTRSYALSNNTLRRRLEAAEGTALALRAEIDASNAAAQVIEAAGEPLTATIAATAGKVMPRRFVVGDEVCDDSARPTLMRVTRTWNKGAILACEYTSGGTRLTRVVRADIVRPLTPDESAVES